MIEKILIGFIIAAVSLLILFVALVIITPPNHKDKK